MFEFKGGKLLKAWG